MSTKSLLIILVVLFVPLGGIALVKAADNAKPGEWLYQVDKSLENFQISLAASGGEVKKAEIYIAYAEERLDEIELLLDNLDTPSLTDLQKSQIEDLLKEYAEHLDDALKSLENGKRKEEFTDAVVEKTADVTLKHFDALNSLYARVDTESKKAILDAMDKSIEAHDAAITSASTDARSQLINQYRGRRRNLEELVELKRAVLEKNTSNQLN